jgi:hypothetical protein
MERLISEHKSGIEDTRGLWSLLMLELQFQEFIDRNSATREHSASSV